MVWKKKLRSPQYTFNSEKVFLVATQPGKSSLLLHRINKCS